MAKKGGPVALQTEVTTDEEWAMILDRKGLVLVDVYSEWSGPCVAMVSSLKKIKMEYGGDVLSYAVARNDTVTDLARFRGKCEPVWMFIQSGQMVNMMFGAHGPDLSRLLIEEIRRVQRDEAPRWSLPVSERGPDEQKRWEVLEEQRLAKEKVIADRENAEKRAKYEAMLTQMMMELSEETALLIYPWVFLDEEGNPVDKKNSPPYCELVNDLFEQCFDVVEETRLQLTEDVIKDMFVESGVELTEDIMFGLTGEKCMVMRLKGRPPHPDWPVKYPVECPDKSQECPTREINDVENYLLKIIFDQPPPLVHGAGSTLPATRTVYEKDFASRHVYVHEPNPELEDDVQRTYPAVWVPPQARSKVHVFKTIFPRYMEVSHVYEEVPPPLPKCFFKYRSNKLKELTEAVVNFDEAIDRFGIFEVDNPPVARRIASSLEDFEKKVKHKTGNEVFVVVLDYLNEETFLGFAGIEPYFESQSPEEIMELINLYFPEGAVDEIPVEVMDSFPEIYGEEEYDYGEEEYEDEDENEEDLDEDVLFD